MKRGPRKGYVQSPEHKANIRASQKKRHEKKMLQKALEFKDTACSLCNEFALPEEYLQLGMKCKGKMATRECVFEKLLTRILKNFKMVRKKK